MEKDPNNFPLIRFPSYTLNSIRRGYLFFFRLEQVPVLYRFPSYEKFKYVEIVFSGTIFLIRWAQVSVLDRFRVFCRANNITKRTEFYHKESPQSLYVISGQIHFYPYYYNSKNQIICGSVDREFYGNSVFIILELFIQLRSPKKAALV